MNTPSSRAPEQTAGEPAVAPPSHSTFHDLMRLLKSDDREISLRMVIRVRRFCRPVIISRIAGELAADLCSRNVAVREKANLLLMLLYDRLPGGPRAAEYETEAGYRVAALVNELTDPDRAVRLRAIEQLGELRDAARITLPVLKRLLADPDREVQRAAAVAIGAITGELPDWRPPPPR